MAAARSVPSGAAAAAARSKRTLKGGHPGETSVDVCAHRAFVVTEALVCARQRSPQFPLRPYRCCQFWFEKQPEGRSPGGNPVDVCADGGIAVGEVLVCPRHARLNSHCAPTGDHEGPRDELQSRSDTGVLV